MFSLTHQIEKAFDIAANNPDARIGVFCNWKHTKPVLDAVMREGAEGLFYANLRSFVHSNGAVVKFFQVTSLDELYSQICGWQFSHVFVREAVTYEAQSYIRSRLRSAKAESFTEPMGYYDEFGVIRYEVY